MYEKEFAAFAKNSIAEGQQRLAEVLKTLLYKTRPDLFELLDFDNDEIFLEPLLFAYFNTTEPQVGLEQILFGHIAEHLRPQAINVFADAGGVVHLPLIGYFETGQTNRQLLLEWDKDSASYSFRDGDRAVDYSFRKPTTVAENSIEVFRLSHQLFEGFYRDANGNAVEVETTDITRRHLGHLNAAFEIIKKYYTHYYEDILSVMKRLVIYRSERINSFATLSAHGAAFLNAQETDDEVFFIEDLLHQCGHVIFSALTLDKQSYFKVDPDTPLGNFSHVADEPRTLYVTLHGVFTEAAMNQCLDICEENNIFSGRQKHELLGRFAFILKRFGSDLENLNHPGIFSEKGLFLYHKFRQIFDGIYRRRKSLLARMDVSNQSYNFSYRRFAELNPL